METTPPASSQDPARRWLRECLCAPYSPTAAARARELQVTGLDGTLTFKLAVSEGVAPLVYDIARTHSLLPSAAIPQWHAAQVASARRSLYFFHQLAACLSALADAGVPVLVLKGAALALTHYRNPTLRPMRDLDLLIQPGRVDHACAVMQTLGYSPLNQEPQPGAHREFENEIALLKQGSAPTVVDLHWSLIDSPYYQSRVAHDWFRETARTVQSGGMTLNVLGKEAQFLYACAHLWLHHRGDELLWLNDARVLFEADAATLAWDVLFARAAQFGWTLALERTLTCLRDEWYAELPLPAQTWLAAPHSAADEVKQVARLRDRASAGRRFWSDLAAIPAWDRRIRFAASNLFPTRAYMRRRYALQNPILIWLAYPYRWWRGIRSVWKP